MRATKLFTIAILSVIAFSCGNSEECNSPKSGKVVTIANNPSELAQLMRDMDSRLNEISADSENGTWSSLDFDFPAVTDLEPTTESMITSAVEAQSRAFEEIKGAYNANPSQEGYELIIQGCLNCHYQSCPGPIERIENHSFDFNN